MAPNNTPIEPAKESTGTVHLPLARVKKIINSDEDIGSCSNNAAFAIAVATEQFVQLLVEAAQTSVRAERKPRRNIQYKDVANAVARMDNLEFLVDVVPRTMTFKQFKDKQAAKERGEMDAVETGQRTLDQQFRFENTTMEDHPGQSMHRNAQYPPFGTFTLPAEPPYQSGSAHHSPSTSRSSARPVFDAVRDGYREEQPPVVPKEMQSPWTQP